MGLTVDIAESSLPLKVSEAGHNFFHSERLTISTAAVRLTTSIVANATFAFITVETASVRIRLTGENPTSSVGKIVDAGDIINLENEHEIAKFRAIRKDGTNATLDVEYGI